VTVALLTLGAFLLYPTAVPDDLSLGPIDVASVFGAHLVERAQRYERFFYVDWLLAQIALLVTLWIYAKRGVAFMRESSAGPIGTGMLLGMLGLAIAWLVHVPFALAAHWWQRRWDQNDLSYLDWLFQDWAVLAAEFLSICAALLIVMGLARKLGDRWWLPGAAVFVGIAALFSFVAPYLDFTTTPLKDRALIAAASEYESKLGIGHIPLRVEKVSPDTDEANAYAFGLGPSRRVVFWDTILRKCAHVTEYAILAFLLRRAVTTPWAAAAAFLYACSDEYHQSFVVGREGRPRDVAIDSIGIVIGLLAARRVLR
jgi:VanZ family protein